MTSPATEREFIYVDSGADLGFVTHELETADVIAFDTEFVGESSYEPKLCLLQVATPAGVWIIDPLAGLDLRPFWLALTAPGKEVVALAARQEVLFCLRGAGRPPARVFDPQVAAGLVGFGYPLSHTNLVRHVLGVRVPGGESYTDWRRRPLSTAQLEYAASDVAYLLRVRERLLRMADDMGRRAWIEDECERLLKRVVHGDQTDRWRRLSGVTNLDRRELAVARELWSWRETEARRQDLPPRRVLGDELLVAIARRKPRTLRDLMALRGINRPHLRRAAEALLEAVRKGLQLPEAELPELLRRDDPPQLGPIVQLMAVLSNQLAARSRVDPALLATNADLQDFVRWHLSGDGEKPAVLEGWRGEILGRALHDLLTGRSAVRIADVRSPTPFEVVSRDSWT